MKKTLRLPVMAKGYLGTYSIGFTVVVDDFDAFYHCWKTMFKFSIPLMNYLDSMHH